MPDRVCLDAGVVVKLFVPEEGQERALALLARLRAEGAEIVAPAFFAAEVLSVLRHKVARGQVAPEDGEGAVGRFLALLAGVRQLSDPALYQRAWGHAAALQWPTVYDAVYLAVAEAEGAELWTANERLHSQTHGSVPGLRINLL